MSATTPRQQPHVFGDLLPPEFLVAHHVVSGGLHQAVANECAALAATHLDGLAGKTTIHPGAGFGADMWSAYLYGADSAIGLELSPKQIAIGQALVSAGDCAVYEKIVGCRAVLTLYPFWETDCLEKRSAHDIQGAIREAIDGLLGSVRWARGYGIAARLDLRQCDLIYSADVRRALDGTQGDAAIANFLFNMLVSGERPPHMALELLAPLVKPGGVLVISLPAMSIQVEDECLQRQVEMRRVTNHSEFVWRHHSLLAELKEIYGEEILAENVRPSRIIKEIYMRAGSPSFEHVSSHLRAYRAPVEAEADVIVGLLLFHAVFATGRPAVELVDLVRRIFLERPYQHGGDVGMHVQYHVLRKR